MNSPRFQDGRLHEKPLRARALVRRPFADRPVPDVTSKTYEQFYTIDRARWSPRIAVRTSGAPDKFSGAYLGEYDAQDLTAYLVAETDPDDDVIDALRARVRRVFANIPADQVSYDMRPFNRPNLHGVKKGSYWGVSFDDGETSHLFAVRKTITAIATLVATSVTRTGTRTRSGTNPNSIGSRDLVALTTFTADVTGPTAGTSNFFNSSSAAVIQSAFTARGLTAVSVSRSDFKISANWTGAGTVSISSGTASTLLEGGAGSCTITSKSSVASTTDTQTISESESESITETNSIDNSARVITCGAGHAANVGDHCAFFQGDKIVGMSKVRTVPNSTDFTVPLADVPGKDFTADTVVFSSGAALRYVNGTRDCTIRITEKYYLPGVTGGVTTGADVPSVPTYIDPINWMNAISTGLAYAAIASPGLKPWKGPILVKTIEEVQMSDALESRDINA